MFERIESRGVDNLLNLMQAFRADTRQHKVDLVVGVYKDEHGHVPVMQAVKGAERLLLEREDTKGYVGISGDREYRELAPGLVLGEERQRSVAERLACVQTPGGTGALKVAFDFLNSIDPGKRIWLSTPTWANHVPLAEDAGLIVDRYPYFRPSDRGLDFEAMMSHLVAHSRAGDFILLHACCHNPTGVDLSLDQWKIVTEFVVDRNLLPIVDCAYQGLGNGLDEDVAGLRYMVGKVPEMLIASSFSKNFGIYRERTGALCVLTNTSGDLGQALQAVETVVRSNYSMPPSHGARIVATILRDAELRQAWESELTQMRQRIAQLREDLLIRLQERHPAFDYSFLVEQRGMFSFTGLSPENVRKLKEDFGVYMAGDGRINVAGLSPANLDLVADGFAQFQDWF
ncbi:amino acid aminotransferase [Roseibium sp. SCP14]|uniref:amino acid aminotransferase n=1 Tax=Roseibium sp. SCP14 TaxID=3141375 RepID=UPI00333AA2E2